MTEKRQIEIFSAGCAACDDAVELVNSIACDSCEVTVLDMHDAEVAERARSLGVARVPAVVIDGRLADCCTGGGPDAQTLRDAGIGQPLA